MENNKMTAVNKPMESKTAEEILKYWEDKNERCDFNTNEYLTMRECRIKAMEEYASQQKPEIAWLSEDDIETKYPTLNKNGYYFKRNSSKKEGAKWAQDQLKTRIKQSQQLTEKDKEIERLKGKISIYEPILKRYQMLCENWNDKKTAKEIMQSLNK